MTQLTVDFSPGLPVFPVPNWFISIVIGYFLSLFLDWFISKSPNSDNNYRCFCCLAGKYHRLRRCTTLRPEERERKDFEWFLSFLSPFIPSTTSLSSDGCNRTHAETAATRNQRVSRQLRKINFLRYWKKREKDENGQYKLVSSLPIAQSGSVFAGSDMEQQLSKSRAWAQQPIAVATTTDTRTSATTSKSTETKAFVRRLSGSIIDFR